MPTFIDFREEHLKTVFFRVGFKDVIFDEDLNNWVPNIEYSGLVLKDNPFEAHVTFHEVSNKYPSGNHVPFLTIKAIEEFNEVVINTNQIKKIRIVASAEWKKPDDEFLSVWSTSSYIDLTKQEEFRVNLIMDQVSIGREVLLSYVSFSPAIDPDLAVDKKINLFLELVRADVGKVFLPSTVRITHKINLDEALVLEIPRGQWYYSVRSVEI